jgi:hypothetical protein
MIQILIDLYLGLYNTAVVKFIVTIMITLLLNYLCEKNLGIISWIFVLLPLIFIGVIVTTLLYIFGMSVSSEQIKQKYEPSETIIQGDQLVFEKKNPKHGLSKYVCVPFSKNSNTVTNKPVAENEKEKEKNDDDSDDEDDDKDYDKDDDKDDDKKVEKSNSKTIVIPKPTTTNSIMTTFYSKKPPIGTSSPQYESFTSY